MEGDLNIARRKFLKIAGLSAAMGISPGFGLKRDGNMHDSSSLQDMKLNPVKVSPDRVIRTVVGLRPYRPSGFVVRTEPVNSKTVVHNYGHGGAGITLSWGTSQLAVDIALQTNKKSFAVIGCGVVGLSTAILLQRNGFKVIIYAKDLPPATTSNIAGGFWFPTSIYEKSKVSDQFQTQFDLACKISHRMFQDYIGDYYGVWWTDQYSLGESNDFPGGKELYPNIKEYNNQHNNFGFDYVQQFSTMMIEPPIYLNALRRDFFLAGGEIKVRTFQSLKDVASLRESVIINCTGLGSGKLFNDTEITPVRGQLCILMPQPEIDYCYSGIVDGQFIYMLPRKDGILLGGTFQKGNWSLTPDDSDSEMILSRHLALAKSMGG